MTFWCSVFSEPDGTGSFSRVGTGFLLVNLVAMLWYVVIHNHALPSEAAMLAWSASMLPLYGTNRGTDFLTNSVAYLTSLVKK
jgi:hypothetical protein